MAPKCSPSNETNLKDDILTCNTLNEEEEGEQTNSEQLHTGRARLEIWLEDLRIQTAVVATVFLDILLVSVLLLIDLQIIQEPPGGDSVMTLEVARDGNSSSRTVEQSKRLQLAENILHIMQLVLLCVFMLEMVLRILARGLDLLDDKLQIFDGLVVLVTFALYVCLTAAVQSRTITYAIGYIIILRLWRIGRIYNIASGRVTRRAERIIIAHRKAWKHAEERLKVTQAKLSSQQREMILLQEQARRLQLMCGRSVSQPHGHVPGSLTALHSHSQPNLTATDDGLTSEDEYLSDGSQPAIYRHVSVEVSREGIRPTPNGSVPSQGSAGSVPNGSIPGTPKSSGSHEMFVDEPDSIGSETSTTRVPDIVEDTQSAELKLHDSPHMAQTSNSLEVGITARTQSDPPVPPPRSRTPLSVTPAQYYDDVNPTCVRAEATGIGHALSQGRLGARTEDPSVSLPFLHNIHSVPIPEQDSGDGIANAGPVAGVEGVVHVDVPVAGLVSHNPAGREDSSEGSPQDTKASTVILRRKPQKERSGDRSGREFAYSNPGFEDLTEEEIKEIRRISAVPFGSTTYLTKEGIPMTDL